MVPSLLLLLLLQSSKETTQRMKASGVRANKNVSGAYVRIHDVIIEKAKSLFSKAKKGNKKIVHFAQQLRCRIVLISLITTVVDQINQDLR
jgi:hypothetical protein